jgi:hypothetical protein
VLMELLFLWVHQLRACPEQHRCYGEVLGGLFRDGSPVNSVDDAATYLLCALAREHLRTMCGSRTSGWSLPCVMSD